MAMRTGWRDGWFTVISPGDENGPRQLYSRRAQPGNNSIGRGKRKTFQFRPMTLLILQKSGRVLDRPLQDRFVVGAGLRIKSVGQGTTPERAYPTFHRQDKVN